MRAAEHAARFIEEFSDRIFYGTYVRSSKQKFHIDFDKFLDKMVADEMLSKENNNKIVRKNAINLLCLEKLILKF